ncbi:hypothetical protein AKJ18_19810 [Vibrio xuii]|nr:hypothetical protein AKJ18_19810 [Vibrio xuii]
MSLPFKYKIIFSNAVTLILFVALLTCSTISVIRASSQSHSQEIRESIIGHNNKLLLTFVKAQSMLLTKDTQIIFKAMKHAEYDFNHTLVNQQKDEALRNKKLAYINTFPSPFIKKVRFINMERNQEISITENGIESRSISLDLNRMKRYYNYYLRKEVNKDNVITKLDIYIRLEGWDNALLNFDINLEYFSNSLAFENMFDKFQYRYFLVDQHGRVVVDNTLQNTKGLMNESVFYEKKQVDVSSYIMSHDSGSFVVNSEQGVFNMTFVKNNQIGWRLVLVTPEDVIHSSYAITKKLVLAGDNLLIKSLSLASISLLILFLFFNSFMVNKILMPISQLIVQAKCLKQRDFNKSAYIVHSSGDEIEQLSNAFFEAGVTIQNLIEGLELEIEERTQQYEAAAQAASEANKQKSKLLSNVSHEIRTPLNAIIGYTHMLTHNKNFNDYDHELSGISNASNTILNIVNDLLDFERLKALNYSLNPKCLSLISLMSKIENTFLPLSKSKQLSLDIVCNVDTSTTLMVDELRIKQVINNIVANALKFTNKGGVTIEVSADDKAFNISVSDTGCGIPKDKLDLIFNSFEQANQEDQQFGFGLGLAIAKCIVDLMNGSLSVESELGTGTTFIISLPAHEIMNVSECSNSVIKQENNTRESFDYTNKKALIVDDVEFNREILEFHLNALGFECTTANDGLEALTLASEHDYHVVLTDISMPVMNGIELASELAKLQPSLPIIAVTARATVKEVSRMNQYFSCYLTKPLTPDDLKAKLYCALSNGTC